MMSRTTRSGCQVWNPSTAPGPSWATATLKPSAPSRAAIDSAIVGSSSTTSTLRWLLTALLVLLSC